MSFLIVDDNQVMRRTIGRLVRDLTDEVIECADGAEAFLAYQANLPEWVLMDVEMPGVDGIAATRQIVSSFPRAKIIIVTSHESAAMREKASRAGACGYVLKENLSVLRAMMARASALY